MNGKKSYAVAFAALLALALFTAPAFAGGPLAICQPGQPYLWPNGGVNIPFNPDQGTLGPLTNAQAVAQVATAFQAWEDVPSASVTYLNAGPLPVDVDLSNFFPFIAPAAPDGLSAIVFDANGEIFDFLFGPNSGILGFAGPEWVNTVTCEIAEGLSFLNGAAVSDLTVLEDISVHEFGHYTNLAHTVVNGQVVLGDTTGPTPFDTFEVTTLVNLIETMYPFYFGPNAGTRTPHKDDIASLSTLYPEPTFASSTGTITGKVLSIDGTTRLTGVNVIARNTANPFEDAVSAISSDFTDDFTPGAPGVGEYTLRGLTPNAFYAVFVDEILAGGFSTPPLNPLPSVEEYLGIFESTSSLFDPPQYYLPLYTRAGRTISRADIQFNRLPIHPVLHCVDDNGDGTFTAHFGYENENNINFSIAVGSKNKFIPSPKDRGQPTTFLPGVQDDVFTVDFPSYSVAIWLLDFQVAKATSSSPLCP
jgi:hypothetical protein